MTIEFDQTKIIEGYAVEVWPADENGIEHAYISKDEYFSSWESLEANCTLDDRDFNELPVSQDDIDAIEDWLAYVGYFEA